MYGGDYSQLTDLARMTVQCSTLDKVLHVLEVLFAQKGRGWVVLLAKNRVHPAFEAHSRT